MKIYTLKEFVQLPEGVIFQEIMGERHMCISPLQMKGTSLGEDDFTRIDV